MSDERCLIKWSPLRHHVHADQLIKKGPTLADLHCSLCAPPRSTHERPESSRPSRPRVGLSRPPGRFYYQHQDTRAGAKEPRPSIRSLRPLLEGDRVLCAILKLYDKLPVNVSLRLLCHPAVDILTGCRGVPKKAPRAHEFRNARPGMIRRVAS
jgi:hypothetical protein